MNTRAEDGRVLVRVTLGQVPRDTSAEDGQVIAVDREQAEALEAAGVAVRVPTDAAGVRVRYGNLPGKDTGR